MEYAQQGQDINFRLSDIIQEQNNKTLNIELDYLRIPVLINYTAFKCNKCSVGVYTGLTAGFATRRKDNYNDIILEAILLPPPKKRYKNFDLAIPFGVNYKQSVSRNVFANFGAEYSAGINNFFRKNGSARFGVLSGFRNSKQNLLSIIAGIGLKF